MARSNTDYSVEVGVSTHAHTHACTRAHTRTHTHTHTHTHTSDGDLWVVVVRCGSGVGEEGTTWRGGTMDELLNCLRHLALRGESDNVLTECTLSVAK